MHHVLQQLLQYFLCNRMCGVPFGLGLTAQEGWRQMQQVTATLQSTCMHVTHVNASST